MLESEKDLFKEEDWTKIAIYAGALGELDKIDISFLNLRFSKIESTDFEEFLRKADHESLPAKSKSYFKEFEKEWHGKELFVVHPIDLSLEFDTDIYFEIQNVFLIMFPSDFRLFATVDFQLFDKKYLFSTGSTTWPFYSSSTDDLYGNFMYIDGHDILEINDFLKIYFERKDSLKYLKVTRASYINSFFQRQRHMSYVSLCISLESITNGTSELLYRIRRNCAVINGGDKERARTIFNNVKHLYDLRSKIVHGEDFDWEKLEKFYPKLRALVSRTLIELITLNISTVDDLNNRLTETGFGEKHLLADEYKKYTLDISSNIKVILSVK